jgi:aminopeptidase N
MLTLSSLRRSASRLGALLALPALSALWGCATPAVKVTAYDIQAGLDPASHLLTAQTTLTLHRYVGGPFAGPVTLDFALNRSLKVESIAGRGVKVQAHTLHDPPAAAGESGNTSLLVLHRLVLASVARDATLTFTYAGELVQDVQAGEKRGQIHNLMMAAHIAPEGIFLDAGGGWYPSIYQDPAHPEGELAAYHLTVAPVEGMLLVAGADFDEAGSQGSGKLVWHSKYPLTGLVLVGGPHQVKEQQVGDVDVAIHYSLPSDPQSRETIEKHTDLFLAAAKEYLQRYPPLVGPYPFDHYTIVENFFSSGFAFPEFTLLNKVLLQMGPRALGHGYLDHEMLHSWWGNTIYPDPADGDWCEALTSYGANYYGYVLDGDEKGARNQRRNACMAISRLKPEDDKPLGTFGRPGGAGRDIGYSKGAQVFHMLARQIGQDTFWAAIRRLTHDYTGRYASWHTLQRVFEQQSDQTLRRFFQQWVRDARTPRLDLENARWHDAEHTLDVTLTQGPTDFALAVPLHLVYDDGQDSDKVVNLETPTATIRLPLDRPPSSIVLDPDFHVLRELRPEEIVPNSATTRADRKLLIVTPAGPLSKFYQRVIEDFTGEPGAKEVTQRPASEVTPAELAGQSVLILGDAVRSGPVQTFLARTNCPLRWPEGGFELAGVLYDKPEQAVLCTVHHPDQPAGGVTIYYGNSETATGRSDLLAFYRDSLVVFETTRREVDGVTAYDSKPVGRRDFESQQSIPVSR